MNQINQEVQQLDHTEKDLQALKREYTTNEKNYQTYVTRAEEARISENMDRLKLANISVIQSATAPVEPVGPLRGKFILQGVIFGLIAGLGVAFLSEYLRQGLSTPKLWRDGWAFRFSLPFPTVKDNVMYLNFYNLKKEPFNITPDPELLFLSPSHKEALAAVIYGVMQRKGLCSNHRRGRGRQNDHYPFFSGQD